MRSKKLKTKEEEKRFIRRRIVEFFCIFNLKIPEISVQKKCINHAHKKHQMSSLGDVSIFHFDFFFFSPKRFKLIDSACYSEQTRRMEARVAPRND